METLVVGEIIRRIEHRRELSQNKRKNKHRKYLTGTQFKYSIERMNVRFTHELLAGKAALWLL